MLTLNLFNWDNRIYLTIKMFSLLELIYIEFYK